MRVLSLGAVVLAAAAGGGVVAASRGGSRHHHRTQAAARPSAAQGRPCRSPSLPRLDVTRAAPPAALVGLLPTLGRARQRGDLPTGAAVFALRSLRTKGVAMRGARRIGARALWLVAVKDIGGLGCARHPARAGALVVAGDALTTLAGGTVAQIRAGRATVVQSCFGLSGELLHVGVLLPGSVQEASLLARDGSSVQAKVSDGYAEFVLPLRDAAASRSRTLVWLDAAGARHREPVELPGLAVHCPPAQMSVGMPVGRAGERELRLAPLYATGARFVVTVRTTRRGICVRVPGAPVQPCLAPSVLSRQQGLQSYAFRLPHGVTVLDGLADPSSIRAIRVRRVGWPSGMRVTLPLSRSGAFALAERGRFVHGGAWQLRAILRSGRPGTLRSVGIGPALGGYPAARIAEQLVAHYAVLRRPRTKADELPLTGAGLGSVGGASNQFDVNPAFSRLVGRGGHARFWLVPGERSLCLVEASNGNRGGSVGCGSTDQPGYYNGHAPMGSGTYSAPRRGTGRRHFRVFVLLPDGCTEARLERDGRTVRRLAIRTNGVVVSVSHGGRVSWRTPDGTRRHIRIG
jgi:hypothetical protein